MKYGLKTVKKMNCSNTQDRKVERIDIDLNKIDKRDPLYKSWYRSSSESLLKRLEYSSSMHFHEDYGDDTHTLVKVAIYVLAELSSRGFYVGKCNMRVNNIDVKISICEMIDFDTI